MIDLLTKLLLILSFHNNELFLYFSEVGFEARNQIPSLGYSLFTAFYLANNIVKGVGSGHRRLIGALQLLLNYGKIPQPFALSKNLQRLRFHLFIKKLKIALEKWFAVQMLLVELFAAFGCDTLTLHMMLIFSVETRVLAWFLKGEIELTL